MKHFIYKQYLIHQDFILKKELLKIPIFGWYLKKLDQYQLDRNKTTKNNLGFFDEISYFMINQSDRPLIIFPQGTRLNQTTDHLLKKV